MTNNDKEKWIEEVLSSMKGSSRARPGKAVLVNIERQIEGSDAALVPLVYRRVASAAAVLLVFLNVFVIQQYAQHTISTGVEPLSEEVYQSQLISNYKIYEQ